MHGTQGLAERVRRAAAALAAVAAVFAPPTAYAAALSSLQVLQEAFIRYAATGRGNAHITLGLSGSFASARVRARADGSFACDIAGLGLPDAFAANSRTRLQWTGVLIHEITHCLTSPYLAGLQTTGDDPDAAAAAQLLLLTQESISDARAVIEIFRRDGIEAAREFVSMALPARRATASAAHRTTLALELALEHAGRQAGSAGNDSDSFLLALQLGSRAAAQTLRDALAASGQVQGLQARAVGPMAARIRDALVHAHRAFRDGPLANNAVTLRSAIDTLTPGDHHLFTAGDGAPQGGPAIGMETAHAYAELTALLASSDAPEHRLAVAWLQREGQLDSANLIRCRAAFARLLKAFGGESPPQAEQALHLLADVVARARKGTGLTALLEDAVDALKPQNAQPGRHEAAATQESPT